MNRPSRMPANNELIAAAVGPLLVLAAVILRSYGLDWQLPEVYEEATPLRTAWKMWGEADGKLALNPHFFNYPSLTIYVHLVVQVLLYMSLKLAGVVRSIVDFHALYVIDKTTFYIAGRLVSVAFGAGTVWLTFVMGRRMGGYGVAIPAAFLLAVCQYHIERSQLIEVDVPLTFFVTLALCYFLLLLNLPSRKHYLLAGLAVGLAASTKYNGALLLLPLVAAHLIAVRRNPDGPESEVRWWYPALSVVAAGIVFAATSPYVLMDLNAFYKHFGFETKHMAVGHFGLDRSSSLGFYAAKLVGVVLHWPATLLALGSLVLAAFVRRRGDVLVLLALILPFFIAISTWQMRAERYLLPILPTAIVLAALFVQEALRTRAAKRLPPRWRPAVIALATVVVAVPYFLSYPRHLARLKPDPRTEAKNWIEANVPSGSFIVTELQGPDIMGPHQLQHLNRDVFELVHQRLGETPVYVVLQLMMFSVEPHLSAAFYDLSLYEMADIFITTGTVSTRYERDPSRFAEQVAFYRELDARFERVGHFEPDYGTGTSVSIFRNPKHDMPYANRSTVEGPGVMKNLDNDKSTGQEGGFYFRLGLYYEMYGHLDNALKSYELGLLAKRFDPNAFVELASGKARCLVGLGRRAEAEAFVRKCIDTVPNESTRTALKRRLAGAGGVR